MKATLLATVGILALAGALPAAAGPVNVNTADAATLANELTGVGPALAEAIVADRKTNGNFTTPESLTRVKGIGQRIVEVNRPNILVAEPPAAPAAAAR